MQSSDMLAELSTALARANYSSTEDVCRVLCAISDIALAAGIDSSLLSALQVAAKKEDWTEAAQAYASASSLSTSLYVGPLRPRQSASLQMGAVLTTPDLLADKLARYADNEVCHRIGSRLFGAPLVPRIPLTQFRNLRFAPPSFVSDEDPAIALFTPFLMGDWPRDVALTKRVEIFPRVVATRLLKRLLPFVRRIDRQHSWSMPLQACSFENLKQACTLWLSLHESLHANGPIPLFDAQSTKSQLGLQYAFVEEFRVDASVFLGLAAESDAPFASLSALVILAERALRSALLLQTGGRGYRKVEHDNGRLWLFSLLRGKALLVDGCGQVHLDMHTATRCIEDILHRIYSCEDEAMGTDPVRRRQNLAYFAADLDKESEAYLSRNSAALQLNRIASSWLMGS